MELDTKITDEKKIELLRRAINSTDGWQALAQSITNSMQKNLEYALQECKRLFQIMFGDKTIEMPAVRMVDGEMATDSSDEKVEMMEVKIYDLMCQKLEHHLSELDKINKTEKE